MAAPASCSSQGLFAQGAGGFLGFALHAVAAQGVHGLRRQAQVGAHGNAALHQEFHRGRRPAAAFELDHVRAGLHQHVQALRRACSRLSA
jgi:hypothetical protein